jgi:branched-subunit amino acid transport protein
MNAWSAWSVGLAIVGLAAITFVTRGFFLIPEREWPLPPWLREGLRYAPLAALAAVVVPEIISTQGRFVSTWADARLWGAAAGAAWYFWRRDILGTILCGMVVYLPLRLGLGWA